MVDKPKRWFWRKFPKRKLSKGAKMYLSEKLILYHKTRKSGGQPIPEELSDWEVNLRMDYSGSKNKGRTAGHNIEATATVFVKAHNAEDAKLIAAEKIKMKIESSGGQKWSFSPNHWDTIGINKVQSSGNNEMNYRWSKQQNFKKLQV